MVVLSNENRTTPLSPTIYHVIISPRDISNSNWHPAVR